MAENIVKTRFQHAYKTESEWSSSNPILRSGEVGYIGGAPESTNYGRYKVGDGTTHWNDLPCGDKTIYSKFDGIEIGGRNLLKYDNIVNFGSGTTNKSDFVSTGRVVHAHSNGNDGFRFDSYSCYNPATVYVLSGYLTINTLSCENVYFFNGKNHTFISFTVDGENYSSPLNIGITTINNVLNDGNPHYFELKFKTNSDIPSDNSVAYTFIQLNKNSSTEIEYTIDKFKLEKGTIPTDWTPAPEDKADVSHTHAASDITSGTLSTSLLPTIPVSKGGTGLTSLTSGQVLVGNGTGNVSLRAIDTTSGGTSDSTSLITSGAVFAGLSGKSNTGHTHTKSEITDFAHTHTLLSNLYSSRPASADVTSTGSGGISTFKATSSMTTNKPASDGHIIHFFWDNTGGYDAQLTIPTRASNSGYNMQYRGMNAGTWGEWKTLLDSSNYNNYAPTKTGTGASGTWGISISGNSATATKFRNAITIQTDLGSTSSASFDGSANVTPGVTGTLPVANGGTGQTTLANAANALINGLSTGSATPQDADYYISQYVGGGTTTTTYHRRPMSSLWEYIKGKTSSVLGLTVSSYGGNSATATKFKTACNINGTSFDGSSDITTENWGTARNVTIANATKSVNGSTDITFSASEIGLKTSDILPIATETFTGVYASANDFANGTFYFGTITPETFYKEWHIKYRIKSSVPSQNNYSGFFEVELWGSQAARTIYKITNAHYSTSYRTLYYHVLYSLTSTGFTNGYGHALGIGLRSSANSTNSSYPRTFQIDILETDNCSFTFFEAMTKYASIPGTGSTNYNGYSEYDGYNNGLRESGDDNTVTQLLKHSTKLTAGENGIYGYTLVMRDSTLLKFQSIVTSSGNGTSKSKNTSGFYPYEIYFYQPWNNNKVASGLLTGANIYNAFDITDMRYTLNCGTTLTANKPLYLKGTITNGLFYLSDEMYSQDLPTSEDGYVYIYIGDVYDTYRCNISDHNPIFEYANGNLHLYNDQSVIATKDASGNIITSSYASSLEVDGRTVTLKSKSGATLSTITTQDNDTKNTAGSTDTSSKIYLIGATSQGDNPQTYSHDTVYVDTDGCLYSNGTKVSVNGHTHSYIPLSGSTAITGVLRSNSEIQSTSTNAFRAIHGDYGFIIRNDGSSTYFLVTDSGGQYDTFNNYRPLTINNSTGVCNINGNSATATKWKNACTLTIGSTGKSVDGSGKVSWSLSEIGAPAATNGTLTFQLGDGNGGTKVELRRSGSSSSGYALSLVSIVNSTTTVNTLINSDGSRNFALANHSHSSFSGNISVNDTINVPHVKNTSGQITFQNQSFTCGLYDTAFRPLNDNKANLGLTSYRWVKVYAASGTIGTSDERDKNILGNIDERYKKLYMQLKPILFKWKDERIDTNIHMGLGAQTTEKSAISCGIIPSEIGMIEHDYWDEPSNDGRIDRYGINYQEIAVMTVPIVQQHETFVQQHEAKLKYQEEKIKSQNAEINSLKNELRELKDLINSLIQ